MLSRIPLNKIDSISIYVNKNRKSMIAIQNETGADYIINGGLFDMKTFRACQWLKVDGSLLSKDNYNYYGYGWNGGADIACTLAHEAYKNYIRCVQLIAFGVPEKLYIDGVGGVRGRSAIGICKSDLLLFCSTDKAGAMNPETLQETMMDYGCDSALMLDGGGSCQCYTPEGCITSSRIVHNFICIKLKKEEKKTKEYNVVLDAGHGVGTVNGSPDGEYIEQEFTIDVAKRIKNIVEKYGVKVTMTRTGDKNIPLGDRVKLSNSINTDCFVSIHSNAAGNNGWYDARGFMVYTSQASVTAGRNVLANILIDEAKNAGIVMRNTPLAHNTFYVLTATKAPAVLIEYGFHTSREDVENLKNGAYRDTLAVVTAKGILTYLGIDYRAAKCPMCGR